MRARRLLLLLSLLLLVLQPAFQPASAAALPQAPSPESVLASLTPEERVGQLFLVTFDGSVLEENSGIWQLIAQHRVGGVLLSREHNNFALADTPAQAQALISQLQQLAWDSSQAPAASGTYVPLYIATNHITGEGSGAQLFNGLTSLPSELAMGATWSPSLAQESGTVLGRELAAIGFNIYIGPSLDVVDTNEPNSGSFAGSNTFGGDPYWAGEMAKAFITGLHLGSENSLGVVLRHFPGLGSADRLPTEEVATVQKNLEQLKQMELAPFMAVAGAADPAAQADGVMVSHIRFQGFQGNIRATTRPISFDTVALEQLLAVEPLSAWRQEGGLTISDSLGSRSVRLFFDSTGQGFDGVSIARNALLAGNDILYLDNFISTGDGEAAVTISKTIDAFVQKYKEDPVFAERVDSAVLRVLADKLSRYQNLDLQTVLPQADDLQILGQGAESSFKVTSQAATLIYPSADYLNTVLPDAPGTYEYMVVFTDVRARAQCDRCQPQSYLNPRAFQDVLLRIYGPAATSQLLLNRLSSYSFEQLTELLDLNPEPTDPFLADNLKRADWVVFNLDDLDPAVPASYALKRILAERQDLLRDKHVIVFAYGTPYFLDSTEISKVTAYYSLYDKNAAALDVAARLLMQESQARGSLPVSLSSMGYDLRAQLQPDPAQVIPVSLVHDAPLPAPQLTPFPAPIATESTPMPLFRLGEAVRIQAGAIRDRNQHLVPDGTVVTFTVRSATDGAIIAQPEATTQGGLAVVEYLIDREGIFEVTARSEPALTSSKLVLNTQGGLAEVVMPSPTPQPTPTATNVPSPTPEAPATPTPTTSANTTGYPRMGDWLLMLMLVTMGAAGAFALGYYWWKGSRWGMRSALLTFLGGVLAYTFLTLGIAGLREQVLAGGAWFVTQLTFIGMLFGWIAALGWWIIEDLRKPRDAQKQ